jgi:hypothetical protein
MKELINEFKESFAEPKSFRDYHLLVFVLQVLILFVFSVGCFSLLAEDMPQLKTDKGIVSSYFNAAKNVEADKTLCRFPSLMDEDEDNVVKTDKLLDLKNGGLWLSEGQKCVVVSTMFAMIPSAIAYLILGIGRMFKRLRDPYFSALGKTAALLIVPPLGVAVWGAISIFFWFVVCTAVYLLGSLMYLTHLILGIIQLTHMIKARKA